MAPVTETATKVPKKRGPKPKPLDAKVLKPTKPIVRVERSYSRQKRIDVITFLEHHRVFDDRKSVRLKRDEAPDPDNPFVRRPTFKEASDFFKISMSTIKDWWSRRDVILNGKPPRVSKVKGKARVETSGDAAPVAESAAESIAEPVAEQAAEAAAGPFAEAVADPLAEAEPFAEAEPVVEAEPESESVAEAEEELVAVAEAIADQSEP